MYFSRERRNCQVMGGYLLSASSRVSLAPTISERRKGRDGEIQIEIHTVLTLTRAKKKNNHYCTARGYHHPNSKPASAIQYNLSPNVQQMKSELTGECVLAVIEEMPELDSLICRLKSCLSCRPRWSHTWSKRTTPSSCF